MAEPREAERRDRRSRRRWLVPAVLGMMAAIRLLEYWAGTGRGMP